MGGEVSSQRWLVFSKEVVQKAGFENGRLTSDYQRPALPVKHRVAIGVEQHSVAGDDAA